jgi:hypothetical protein
MNEQRIDPVGWIERIERDRIERSGGRTRRPVTDRVVT